MPLRDVVAAALSRPAGKVVEGPVADQIRQALRDHGVPTAADVAALRDRLGTLEGEVEALRAALAAVQPALARLDVLETRAGQLADAADALVQAATRSGGMSSHAADVAAANVAPKAGCKVDGCTEGSVARGFCRRHYDQWKRGTLAGFVGPEGLVSDDAGGAVRVARSQAGKPFTWSMRDGSKRLVIDGAVVDATPLS